MVTPTYDPSNGGTATIEFIEDVAYGDIVFHYYKVTPSPSEGYEYDYCEYKFSDELTPQTDHSNPSTFYEISSPDWVSSLEYCIVHFVGKIFSVTLNANGGSVNPSSKDVRYGEGYGAYGGSLPTPTRLGYSFLGWYTRDSGGTRVTDSTKVTTASNHTLYAHWQPNTYTVRLHRNYTSTDGTTSDISCTYDVSFTIPKIADDLHWSPRSGYTFLGWATSNSATTAEYTDGQSVRNLTSENGAIVDLYAVWTTVTYYTVTATADPQRVGCKVKAGSGSASETTSSVTVTQGTSVEITATPKTPEYIFVGWYENGTRRSWAKSYSVTANANRTYTAKFHLATNLLINRYSIKTPVTLVYDDIKGTNKLVADY